MNAGKLLLGVVSGFAAGALIGVLFAPDKGSETRKKISKKGEDYVNSVKKKFDEFIENVAEKFETVKEETGEHARKSRTNAQEA